MRRGRTGRRRGGEEEEAERDGQRRDVFDMINGTNTHKHTQSEFGQKPK